MSSINQNELHLLYLLKVKDEKIRSKQRCEKENENISFISAMVCENTKCEKMSDCLKYQIELYHENKKNPYIEVYKPCQKCGKNENIFNYKQSFRKKDTKNISEFKTIFGKEEQSCICHDCHKEAYLKKYRS